VLEQAHPIANVKKCTRKLQSIDGGLPRIGSAYAAVSLSGPVSADMR
jgi:hypothetical protein